MPNKIAVIPFLDKLDPIAEMVGAVNTIVNEDGVLTGYSTDGYGFMKSFEEHGRRRQREENGPDGHGWRWNPHCRTGQHSTA